MTLVIDLGTVNTVAMLDGRLVTVDGAPWLPSVVHEGLVGADAAELAGGQAARDLKERLDPDEVRVLFARVLDAARDQGGVIGAIVVTHPAGWSPERVAVLTSAAGPMARAVPEPVAVAAVHGDEPVLVVDAGGGPWHVTAVRGQEVLASAALPFGGNDVDRLIVERVRPSLRSVTDDAALLESARVGKELLSRHDSTEIVLPDHRAVRLDRAEFERLVSADVDRLAALVSEVGGQVRAGRVLLVGGSSRMPLLARRITEVTGLPVTTDPEPETAVVRGAHALTRPAPLEDPLAPPPGSAAGDALPQFGAAHPAAAGTASPLAPGTAPFAPGAASLAPGAPPLGPGAVPLAPGAAPGGPPLASGTSSGAAPVASGGSPGAAPFAPGTPPGAAPLASGAAPPHSPDSPSVAGSPPLSPAEPGGRTTASAFEEPVRPPAGSAPRRGPLALVVLLLLVAAAAVVFGGERAVGGSPVAVGGPPPLPEVAIPPVVDGDEVVNSAVATFTSGALGEATEYRHPAGNTFEVTVTGIETAVTAPQPYLEAPDGFRWLILRLHVVNAAGPDYPHDPMENVAVLDDRGQWLRQPNGHGQIACTEGVPPATRIPADSEVGVCGVVSVPEATPVAAVLFGVRSPEAQAPLRFPVDVPAARDRAAPTRVVGTLGGPAVTVGGLRARVDLVRTPSGYLGEQVPAPGHRFVVVRASVTATRQPHVTILLRDDRGAFLSGIVQVATGCPPLPGTLTPEEPAYGCQVFEVAADTPVSAVTFPDGGPDVTRWPTWR
jgi:actin-like ATPase involved in cell morphogenesis